MYEELVKSLRTTVMLCEAVGQEDLAITQLMKQAADTIEELSKMMQFATLPDDAVIYVTMYGSDILKNKVISITKKELSPSKDWESFVFVWGWPGPDYNCYYFKDYGKTWAFNLKDFSGPYHLWERKR